MQEILSQNYSGNSLQAYLITLGIMLLAFILRLFIAKYIAIIIYHFFGKITKDIPKSTFIKLLAKPLSLFIFYLVSIIAINELHYPTFFDFDLYKLPFKEFLRMIGVIVLVSSFFNMLLKLIDFSVIILQKKYVDSAEQNHHQLFFFAKDLLKVVLIFFAIVIISKYAFNYNVEGFLTGLGVMAAAIALALKENIENLFASFIIFFDKPFSLGDNVTVSGITGVVEKIGLRSTRLRSAANTFVTIPNKQMAGGVVENLSNYSGRNETLNIQIKPCTSKQKLDQLLERLNQIFSKESLKSYAVTFNDISEKALVVQCVYTVYPMEFSVHSKLKQKINLDILAAIEEINIDVLGS